MTRGRHVVFSLVHLALLFLASLLGLELVARAKFVPETIGVAMTGEIVHDPLAGWRGRRGLSALMPHGRHPARIQVDINSDGFRDESWDAKLARADAGGARKILLLGDSLLYGWANPADGRLGEQLQARYAADGRAGEVFDSGIPAYGPANQLRLLPELLERLRPHEVVVVFCTNDFGDAALPYDYRYPVRVYQPFFDQRGELLFNAQVPRRLSLRMRPTLLGGLRLWIALDRLRNVWEDRLYARHGIPNAGNAPVERLDYLYYNAELLARFPYVEPTVLELYRRMALLTRATGARFTFLPSVTIAPARAETAETRFRGGEPLDTRLRGPLESRGVRYLPCPRETEPYQPFLDTLLDGHPNLIWAWILSGALYADFEGRPGPLDFASMPQAAGWPTEVRLDDDAGCARVITRGWRAKEAGGRRFDGAGSFLLGNSVPGSARLEIAATGSPEARLRVEVLGKLEVCDLVFGPTSRTEACALDTLHSGPLVFVTLRSLVGEPLVERLRLLPASPGPPRSAR